MFIASVDGTVWQEADHTTEHSEHCYSALKHICMCGVEGTLTGPQSPSQDNSSVTCPVWCNNFHVIIRTYTYACTYVSTLDTSVLVNIVYIKSTTSSLLHLLVSMDPPPSSDGDLVRAANLKVAGKTLPLLVLPVSCCS